MRFLAIALIIAVSATACSGGEVADEAGSPPDSAHLLPLITATEVEAGLNALEAEMSDAQRELLADGTIDASDVELASAAAQACFVERVDMLQLDPEMILDIREPSWSAGGLFYATPHRVGFPPGTTEPNFAIIDAIDAEKAACAQDFNAQIAEHYAVQNIPTGTDRDEAESGLRSCLNEAGLNDLSQPPPKHCLDEYEGLFVAIRSS